MIARGGETENRGRGLLLQWVISCYSIREIMFRFTRSHSNSATGNYSWFTFIPLLGACLRVITIGVYLNVVFDDSRVFG